MAAPLSTLPPCRLILNKGSHTRVFLACCPLQVAWSFVKLDHSAPQVLDHAARLLVERTSQFGDKAVSNVLWALATERHPLADQARALDAVATNLQVREQRALRVGQMARLRAGTRWLG